MRPQTQRIDQETDLQGSLENDRAAVWLSRPEQPLAPQSFPDSAREFFGTAHQGHITTGRHWVPAGTTALARIDRGMVGDTVPR